jgi:regulator of protease activity HflC (stomatin/prohibitin superfamily)
MFRQTFAVQAFIRTVAFLTALIVLSIFTLLPMIPFLDKESIFIIIAFAFLLIFDLWASSIVSGMFYVLPEWEKLVLLRLGKFVGVKGPGFFVIPPLIYSVANIVDTRITTQKVEATATLTKDNVPTTVTAAIEYEIENPQKAVIAVKDYLSSVIWLSTEALKNTIGSLDLKGLLGNREEIARQLKEQIDAVAVEYGLNVRAVRITDVDTPSQLIEELAVIARARRAAQAKQIQAEAEVLVAQKMAEASQILAKQKGGFRLREIQNLAEISKEESAMIIVYPYDSDAAKGLAHASVALHGKVKQAQGKS